MSHNSGNFNPDVGFSLSLASAQSSVRAFSNIAPPISTVPATVSVTSGADILLGAGKILNDKGGILSHPLFPLMSMLFEKCESATANINKVTSTELFNKEMTEFATSMSSNRASMPAAPPLIGANKELDNLMIKAIQVLRIHLLELEKVNELCLDFCSRYIASIKTKLNSHTLLKGDDSDSEDEYDLGSYCPPMETESSTSAAAEMAGLSSPPFTSVDPSFQAMPPFGSSRQIDEGSLSEMLAHGRTPMSSIGLCRSKPSPTSAEHGEQSGSDLSRNSLPVTSKRGVLPKHATQTMKSWLFQHIVHPYPTEEEKKQLSQQTNLSILQVNNWFINARRRILQPMLDSSSASPEHSKSRKCKAQARQAQRFWPFTPADETAKDTSTTSAACTSVDYPMGKEGAEQSPMLSQANTREISPTLLQTHYSSISNSDSGDCLPDTTGNISEANSHSSDMLCARSSSATSDMTALTGPIKLEPHLDTVG